MLRWSHKRSRKYLFRELPTIALSVLAIAMISPPSKEEIARGEAKWRKEEK